MGYGYVGNVGTQKFSNIGKPGGLFGVGVLPQGNLCEIGFVNQCRTDGVLQVVEVIGDLIGQ